MAGCHRRGVGCTMKDSHTVKDPTVASTATRQATAPARTTPHNIMTIIRLALRGSIVNLCINMSTFSVSSNRLSLFFMPARAQKSCHQHRALTNSIKELS